MGIGFLTELELKTELVRRFGRNIKEFRMILDDGGFDISRLPEGIPNDEIIHHFYRSFLEDYGDKEKGNILRLLANRRKGCPILQKSYQIMLEKLRSIK